ncbi:4409_t:CDS:2, partial [Dentiscutata heterogama]
VCCKPECCHIQIAKLLENQNTQTQTVPTFMEEIITEYTTRFRNLLGQVESIEEEDKILNFIEGLKPATKAKVSY